MDGWANGKTESTKQIASISTHPFHLSAFDFSQNKRNDTFHYAHVIVNQRIERWEETKGKPDKAGIREGENKLDKLRKKGGTRKMRKHVEMQTGKNKGRGMAEVIRKGP